MQILDHVVAQGFAGENVKSFVQSLETTQDLRIALRAALS